MDRKNPLQTVAERLGFMAYLFAVSGGRPDWSELLTDVSEADTELSHEKAQSGGASGRGDAFTGTVPIEELRGREHVSGF